MKVLIWKVFTLKLMVRVVYNTLQNAIKKYEGGMSGKRDTQQRNQCYDSYRRFGKRENIPLCLLYKGLEEEKKMLNRFKDYFTKFLPKDALFAFITPFPIAIAILRVITVPAARVPTMTSYILAMKSSLTIFGLPTF